MTRTSDRSGPTPRPRFWHTAAVACAGLSVGLLPACTSGGGTAETTPLNREGTTTTDPTPSAPALSPAEGPYQIGDCWQEDDYVTAFDWESWEGAPAVDCSEPHNTITYNVADLPEDFPYLLDAEGQLTEPSQEAYSTALTACGEIEAEFGVTSPLPHLNRLKRFWYLPTPEQWERGERFIRCDVGLRAFNSTYSDKALAALDDTLQTLAGRVSASPQGFEMCILQPEGTDPERLFDDTSRLVSCSGDYTWRWVEDYEPTDYVDGPYPGATALQETVGERCGALVLGPGPEYRCSAELPNEEDWAADDMTISLWSTKIG